MTPTTEPSRSEPVALEICIPCAPPSANACWRWFRGHMVCSKEYTRFKELVKEHTGGLHIPESWKYCQVYITVRPTRRRCDVDNKVKPLFDALTYAGVWEDDELVASFYIDFIKPDRAQCPAGSTRVIIIEETEKYKNERNIT